MEEINLNQKVRHKALYDGKEEFTVVGIRLLEVELEGDFSGGTSSTKHKVWMPREGLLTGVSHDNGLLYSYSNPLPMLLAG